MTLLDAAVKTVEWALRGYCCGQNHGRIVGGVQREWPHPLHDPSCPIPSLGYAILKEHHWYERRWMDVMPTGPEKCWMDMAGRDNIFDACRRPQGHDGGIHEPREGELA